MQLNKFFYFLFPGIAVVMLLFALINLTKSHTSPPREVEIPPAASPFENKIAGVGIIEPTSEVINVSTDQPGVVKAILVSEGEEISKDQGLIQLDDSSLRSSLALAEAQVKVATTIYEDQKTLFDKLSKLEGNVTISENEITKSRFATRKALEELEQAKASLEVIAIQLDKSTIKSPIDGMILKINAKIGEYLSFQTSPVPIIVGDVGKLNVRVAVDQNDIHRFDPTSNAVGYLFGDNSTPISLTYLRVIPNVSPKVNLSSSSKEKVDTRVLEIIYSFDANKNKAYSGQQMDVFIEAKSVEQ